MHNSFRFIVIGTGNISETYWSAIKNIQNCQIIGFVSRSCRRPDYVPQSYEIEIKEKLDQIESDFDAVIVTTPNGLHHIGVIEAAQLNKHVLVEKPLDINKKNMEDMIMACEKAGVQLGVSYQRRMSEDNQIIKKMLDQYAFGKIYAADLSVKFWRDQAYYDSASYRGTMEIDGGGPFMQQASHNIDIYCWFFGRPKQIISMTDTFAHPIGVEDHGSVLLRHDSGMIGTMICSTIAYPGYAARLEIHTEKGSLSLVNDIIDIWDIRDMDNPSQCQGREFHSGAGSAAVTNTSGHEAIIDDFVDAVGNNRKPVVSGREASVTTEVILEIYKNST